VAKRPKVTSKEKIWPPPVSGEVPLLSYIPLLSLSRKRSKKKIVVE